VEQGDRTQCDGKQVLVHDFRGHPAVAATTIDVPARTAHGIADHGDGDRAAIAAFLTTVETSDTSHIRSGPRESLASHRVVWAAEQARYDNTTLAVPDPLPAPELTAAAP
jgi:hypothetical protein